MAYYDSCVVCMSRKHMYFCYTYINHTISIQRIDINIFLLSHGTRMCCYDFVSNCGNLGMPSLEPNLWATLT